MKVRRSVAGMGAGLVLAVGAGLGAASTASAAPGPPCNSYHETKPGSKEEGKGYFNNCLNHPVQVEMQGIGTAKVCAAPHENKFLAPLWFRTDGGWIRDLQGARVVANHCP